MAAIFQNNHQQLIKPSFLIESRRINRRLDTINLDS